MKKIFSLISFLSLTLLVSTASANTITAEYPLNKQSVWRASLIALSKYPLEVSNYDQGQIKTKKITEEEFWSPQFRASNPEHLYTLELSIFEAQKGTRVTLKKKLKRKASFDRNEQEIKTQNVEEDLILYRIKRELLIDQAMKKNFK